MIKGKKMYTVKRSGTACVIVAPSGEEVSPQMSRDDAQFWVDVMNNERIEHGNQ